MTREKQKLTPTLLYSIPLACAMILGINLCKELTANFSNRKYDVETLAEDAPTRTHVQKNKEFTVEDAKKLIHDISLEMDVDPLLMQSIATVESRFNTHAKNPKSSGRGLMQVLKGTAKQYCNIKDPDLLYVPSIGVTCGITVWKEYYQIFGSAYKTTAAYMCGPAGLTKGKKKHIKECYSYADRIMRIYTKL